MLDERRDRLGSSRNELENVTKKVSSDANDLIDSLTERCQETDVELVKVKAGGYVNVFTS